MLELFLEHLNEFIIDSIFAAMAAAVYAFYRTRAAIFVLVNYVAILVVAYPCLLYIQYSNAYAVDYHVVMTLYQLIFLWLVVIKVRKHRILKLAIALGALNSGVAALNGPAYDLGTYSYDVYLNIFNSYPILRILIITLQILGLVIYGDDRNGRYDYINNRIRSSFRNFINSILNDPGSILRVKKT